MQQQRGENKGGTRYGNANLNTLYAKPATTQRTGAAVGPPRVGGAMTLLGAPKVRPLSLGRGDGADPRRG